GRTAAELFDTFDRRAVRVRRGRAWCSGRRRAAVWRQRGRGARSAGDPERRRARARAVARRGDELRDAARRAEPESRRPQPRGARHRRAAPIAGAGRAMSARPKILIVDDRDENLIALAELLREQEAEVLAARSGDEALVLLLEHEIAVALVDVQMPEIDGFMLAELMRGAERTREIPIILVTAGFQDPKRVFKGYELGAVDFLHKPIEPQILRSKVSVFVRLHEQKTQLLETQRRLERALAEAYEAAAVRERVASLVSHDLRNPLSTIAMQTEMLKALRAAGRMSESIVDDGLERIERGITKMERLIDELLDVT